MGSVPKAIAAISERAFQSAEMKVAYFPMFSLLLLCAGCATVRYESKVVRAEHSIDHSDIVTASIVSVVPETRAGRAGVLVRCQGESTETRTDWDVSETRKVVIRRVADPVEWTRVYDPWFFATEYFGAEKGLSWTRKLGVFTQTRKFTWAGAFAPSTNIGWCPTGRRFSDWMASWSKPYEKWSSGSPVLPYTLSFRWIPDAVWTPIILLGLPSPDNEVVGLPCLVTGLVGDPICLVSDAVLMTGALGCSTVNLVLLDTTGPFAFDAVTLPVALSGDAVCAAGVGAGDAILTVSSIIPNIVAGVGDWMYPASFQTNITIAGESNSPPRVSKTRSASDYMSMSVSLCHGEYYVRKPLDETGATWFDLSSVAAEGSDPVELILWDQGFRPWGSPRQVALPHGASVKPKSVNTSPDNRPAYWQRYRP